MSEYSGARVVGRQLVTGFHEAMRRFSEGVRVPDRDPGFFALFESLNWAVAIDDFIREVWVPEGEKLDWAWRGVAGGEGLAELMDGTRYARNLVHHHWADALRREEGARFPVSIPRSTSAGSGTIWPICPNTQTRRTSM